jgi:hypothetical protein
MYNEQYKILFTFNPLMQCMLGKFEGWQMVLGALTDTRKITENDQVLFNYSSQSQFNRLVKHINKQLHNKRNRK